jgi:AAA domain
MLTVVIGPPASGKSTWVLEHANPGDIVVDFDRLAVALSGLGGDPHDHPAPLTAVTRAARTAAIEAAIKQAKVADVYLIHSSPGQQRMDQYVAMGAKVVTIDPGRDVVRQRCKTERPQRMFTVIDEWYREHAQQRLAPSSLPVFDFPAAVSREW